MIGTRPEPGQPAGPCCVARPPRGPPSQRRSCSARTRARPRYFTAPEEFELYDLEPDPDEMHNLYGEAAHRDLSGQLAARLTELRRELGDRYVYKPTVVVREENCEEK